MKILAVDDDEIILGLLEAVLDAHNYSDVVLADCGQDALAKIEASAAPFDCFMFDIQMPGMDGTELCRHVRKIKPYADTPIIMITAMNNKEYFDKAFMAGATDYVTKPFDITELLTRIRLADRLQEESKRVAKAIVAANAVPNISFEDSVSVEEIEGVVNPTVLHNYVQQMLAAKNQSIQAFAIKIPELQKIFEGSSAQEFSYVITDIAEVITDLLLGYQLFVSYFGSGIFVCVGPENEMPSQKHIKNILSKSLNDEELVYCEDVKTELTAVVGDYCFPRMFKKTGPEELFGAAIDGATKAEAGSKLGRTLKFIGVQDVRRSA
jgi:DNA-binding response OmpR family regulator